MCAAQDEWLPFRLRVSGVVVVLWSFNLVGHRSEAGRTIASPTALLLFAPVVYSLFSGQC